MTRSPALAIALAWRTQDPYNRSVVTLVIESEHCLMQSLYALACDVFEKNDKAAARYAREALETGAAAIARSGRDGLPDDFLAGFRADPGQLPTGAGDAP